MPRSLRIYNVVIEAGCDQKIQLQAAEAAEV